MKKNNKAKFWLVLWIVAISIGTIISALCNAIYLFKYGVALKTPPFATYQLALLLIFLPFCLIPLLSASYYYANKENNKKIKIASVCLILHHIICVLAVLIQTL